MLFGRKIPPAANLQRRYFLYDNRKAHRHRCIDLALICIQTALISRWSFWWRRSGRRLTGGIEIIAHSIKLRTLLFNNAVGIRICIKFCVVRADIGRRCYRSGGAIRIFNNGRRTLQQGDIFLWQQSECTRMLKRTFCTGRQVCIDTDVAYIMYITTFCRYGSLREIFGSDCACHVTEPCDGKLAGLCADGSLYNAAGNGETLVGQILMDFSHNRAPQILGKIALDRKSVV